MNITTGLGVGLAILFLLSTSLSIVTAQQQQQLNRIDWDIYKSPNTKISIFYPMDWRVVEYRNGIGFDVFSPDNSFNIGIWRLYKGSSPIYGMSDFQLEEIGKHQIESMVNNGFSFISSQTLENRGGVISIPIYGNILKNIYRDNIDKGAVVIEFLQKVGVDHLLVYYFEGTPIQIQKYLPIASKILKTIKFDSSWELQKLKERNAANQVSGEIIQRGVDALSRTAEQIHKDPVEGARECSRKLGYDTQNPVCP